MKKTTLFARLLAGIMTVWFLTGGGVSCSDGSDKDSTPETKYYTVTFNSNGGSEVKPQTVEAGNVAKKPDDPTKEGYTFVGWYNGDTAFSFTTTITANITLTAQWAAPDAEVYTITFDSAGGSEVASQTVEAGKTATVPTAPTRDGYIFVGWYNGDTAFSFATTITANITLTAQWGDPNKAYYTVTFEKDGNTIDSQTVEAGNVAKELTTDLTKEGYKFLGWYNGDTKFDFSAPITNNITLTAKWEQIASSGDNGGEQGSGPSSPIESGTAQQKPSEGTNTNAEVKIVKSEGWLNSAYVIFEQIDGAVYEVTVDGTKIDEQLIRYYDEYAWYEPNEASNLSVTWEKKSHSKVVRADALGLKAGEHTIAVCAVGANNTKTEPSTAKVTVIDHDRSGFAFTGTKTPGAYNKDGTLKSNAVVIYLTDKNKSTVKATLGGKEYTGIKEITQEIKSKNISTPVDIRVIGKVVATSSGKELSSKDLNSAWALGVKGASEVTIEGVGHDATLYGAGVAAFQSEYIEIANLGLMKWGGGKDGDGISLKADSYVWVHNNDVFYGDAGSDGDQVKGDGSMDLKDNANHITIAYNHFWDSGKMSLCGMKSESGPNYITYHHNWFDHSDSRHPRIRTMMVHVYNNYFDGNAKYGVGVTTGASCFVEGNFFRNAHNPMMSSKQGTDAQGSGTFSGEKGGVIKSWNNAFEQNNTNGVKFQFITNKYDYTNNQKLGKYEEWTATIGTQTADGWEIYDSAITSSNNTIATNSLIAVEDASVKGAYYQTSKGKTCFFIDVPQNTTKIVIKAKTGSSSSGATTGIAIKDESEKTIASVSNIGNTAYEDFSFAVSGLTADSTLEIANTGSNSLNISGIKVIAASGWETTLTSGADPKNIDAYEVDARSQKVPDEVRTRSGDTTYSNFDTIMGNAGLGLSADPTGPKAAKTDVLNFSGRHNSDFAHNFSNATDDASYAKNDALNNALVSYKTGFKGIQGTTQGGTTGGGSSGGETGGNEGGNTGNEGGNQQGTGTQITADVTCYFMGRKLNSSVEGAFTINGNYADNKGTATVNDTTYTDCLKMESSTSISFNIESPMTLTLVFASGESGKKVNVDGTAHTTDSSATVTVALSAGGHKITKGDTMNLFYIALKN